MISFAGFSKAARSLCSYEGSTSVEDAGRKPGGGLERAAPQSAGTQIAGTVLLIISKSVDHRTRSSSALSQRAHRQLHRIRNPRDDASRRAAMGPPTWPRASPTFPPPQRLNAPPPKPSMPISTSTPSPGAPSRSATPSPRNTPATTRWISTPSAKSRSAAAPPKA